MKYKRFVNLWCLSVGGWIKGVGRRGRDLLFVFIVYCVSSFEMYRSFLLGKLCKVFIGKIDVNDNYFCLGLLYCLFIWLSGFE